MAGEIQIGGTTFATESGGTVTVSNVDSATNRQNLGLEIGVDVQSYDADTTKNDVANTFTANQIISVTDNTNAALRVTQLGTGNALVVEDETNPDSTPFVVDANGNVGIGTSPSEKLDVVVNSTANSRIHTDLGGANSKFVYLTIDTGEIYDDSRAVLEFSHNGTESASIQNNYRTATGISEGLTIRTFEASPIVFAPNNIGAMTLDSSGNVGIGDSTPDAALDVVGDIHYTGTITDVSDRRLKENITDLTDSLNKVSQLEGKSYTLIADRGNEEATTEYGFIAQNVQEVFPDAVKVIQKYAVDENGKPTEEELNYLGVSYIQLIAPMVEAIKELKAKNESQQSQIDALTARIEALETT